VEHGSPDPDWSGKQVVFVRDDNLMLMDVVDGSLQHLTTYDGVTEHAIQPTFSEDGRHVTFTLVRGTWDVDDKAEGALVDVQTGVVTTLDLPGATHVRLRPQGR
jgi:tricorn protease-like protein